MSYTADQSLAKYGTPKYAGWNEPEAGYDFAATGGGAKAGGGNFVDNLLKAQEEQIKRETSFLEDYVKKNPFVFDEALARKSATAEYQPYYTELLQDYVADLDKQRETTRGEANLLTTLKKIDTGARSREYQLATDRANEGYAGSGMFFSGIRQKATGLEEIGYKEGVTGSEARFGQQEQGLQNQLGQYDIAQQRKTRDIGREQDYAVEGGILTRKKEAQSQYYTPLEQSYYRQFPTGSGNTLKGYTVPEYFRL